MTDRELDDILYEALVVLNTPEYLKLPDEPFPTSERFERRMEKLLADPKGYGKRWRRAARPLWRKTLSVAATVLIVLSASLAGVFAVSPTARAWVERVAVQWLEESVGFRFHGESGDTFGPWRPTYLPEGFQEVEHFDDMFSELGSVFYEKGETHLSFDYARQKGENQFKIDGQHTRSQTIDLDGNQGYLFTATEEGWPNYLVWTDDRVEMAYLLMGDCDEGELPKVARGVKLILKK